MRRNYFQSLLFGMLLIFTHFSELLAISTKDYVNSVHGVSLQQWGYADPLDNFSSTYMLNYFGQKANLDLPYREEYATYLGATFQTDAGTPVYSICNGKVIALYDFNTSDYSSKRYKYLVSGIAIQCMEGNYRFTVTLGFLQNITVGVGDYVEKGQKVGEVAPYYNGNGVRNPALDQLFLGINIYADFWDLWKSYLYDSDLVKYYFKFGRGDASLEDIYSAGYRDPFEYLADHSLMNEDVQSESNLSSTNPGGEVSDSESDLDGNPVNQEEENFESDNSPSTDNTDCSGDILNDKGLDSSTCSESPEISTETIYSVFDAAGSVIYPKATDTFGGSYDVAKMHPHGDKSSTVVFQWLYNPENCKYLKLTSLDGNIDVIVRVKGWKTDQPAYSFKATLDINGISLEKPNITNQKSNFFNVAITTLKPISSSYVIKAECQTDNFIQGNRVSVTNEKVIVDNGYIWTGTSSLISQINALKTYFGIDRDYLYILPNSQNSLASIQWLATPDKCPSIKIDFITVNKNTSDEKITKIISNDSFIVEEMKYKRWDKENWEYDGCSTLPCTINAPDYQYYIIKILGRSTASDGIIKIECVNNQ